MEWSPKHGNSSNFSQKNITKSKNLIYHCSGEIKTKLPETEHVFIRKPQDLRPILSTNLNVLLTHMYGLVRGRDQNLNEVPLSTTTKIPISFLYYSLMRREIYKVVSPPSKCADFFALPVLCVDTTASL
eukprot:TRINITY_DN6487_c1_g2_i10.p1 TRINITY_DN6487_c1_g2~~TRINITY_DN6487_c1_g2_i10.p1  ORF type:complete len:129 (+),score=1.63 TRINITY_DN6487_c1_g2_i10:548-934(+)